MSDDLKLYQKAVLDLGASDLVYVSRQDGTADGKATLTALATLIAGSLDFISWSNITGTPTTLAGYGITDGASINDAVTADDSTWSSDKISAEIAAVTGGIGALLITNNLSDLANAGTARTNLGVAIGSNVQAYSANLTSFATVAPAANVLTFLGATDYAAMRTQLGLGTAALLASDIDGTLAANSDTRLATQKAVKTYVDAQFAGAGTGTVTHTAGALTLNQLVFGNGAADLKVGNLTGDVTTSGGTATTIANDAVTTAKILNANVTLAKIANAAANSKLLGSGAGGAGVPYSELSIGSAFTFATTTLNLDFATTSDLNTGTNATKAINSDVFAGSNFGHRVVQLAVTDPAGSAITTGDGKAYFVVPPELNGMNLIDADCALVGANSSSGAPAFQIHNVTDAVDMLSTAITIDSGEPTSYTAATPPVINAANDDVATGDILRLDCDTAGTGAKGLTWIMSFGLP